MILTKQADAMIFDAMKRGDYLPFAADNARREFQPQADAILRRAVTVVCDGWTESRHARIVLRDGDPERVSHGMCENCRKAMEGQ